MNEYIIPNDLENKWNFIDDSDKVPQEVWSAIRQKPFATNYDDCRTDAGYVNEWTDYHEGDGVVVVEHNSNYQSQATILFVYSVEEYDALVLSS
jgi:hypothetical protein